MYEERFRLVLEEDIFLRFFANHPHGLVLFDLEGSCRLVNRALADMLGYSAEDFSRSTPDFHRAVSQRLKLGNQNVWGMIQTESRVLNREMVLLSKSGEKISVLISGTIVRDGSEGSPLALVSIIDITERKQKEDQLVRSEKQSTSLIESLESKLEENVDELQLWKNKVHQCYRSIKSMNYAMRLLITRIRDQKRALNERVAQNFTMTIQPILDELKIVNLSEPHLHLIEALEYKMKHITSLFDLNSRNAVTHLSPREMEICQMICSGKDSHDIARALGLTYNTVIVHRKSIRKKLGLKQKKQNLANYLKGHLEAIRTA
ncbi:MAG: PAS domain S-box protein [Desulfomonilaceae bacterium]